MKRIRIFQMMISVLLLAATALNLAGCALRVKADDLMEGITPADLGEVLPISGDSAEKAADFAVRLFRASDAEGENVLISPLSVLAALSMTLNGARGDTKAETEAVLGMTSDELNEFFRSYSGSLPAADKYKLSLANSIWFTNDESFTVNRDFLQTNADYYGADAYRAPFDGETLKDINRWVRNRTDGMIPEILDAITPDAVMYLVNALAFEAEWSVIYKKSDISKGKFTAEDGSEKTVEFMHSTEGLYIEDGSARGFIKFYSGQKYAFAAILPGEGTSLSEYVSSLDGKKLHTLLLEAESASVSAAIPKFETGYGTELSDVLVSMGMKAAFDPDKADFSGLGECSGGSIFIGRVLHRTFISVDEKGTKAGAATVVEMRGESCPAEINEVILDRPFVYMLIDTENSLPFFIGTVRDVNN